MIIWYTAILMSPSCGWKLRKKEFLKTLITLFSTHQHVVGMSLCLLICFIEITDLLLRKQPWWFFVAFPIIALFTQSFLTFRYFMAGWKCAVLSMWVKENWKFLRLRAFSLEYSLEARRCSRWRDLGMKSFRQIKVTLSVNWKVI